jgi:3-oxoacyl-[acyl-carrier protein] reductase
MAISRKSIFVTGASRGIGMAIAQTLHDAGHRVAGHASRLPGSDSAYDFPVIAADFTDFRSPQTAWTEALDLLGGKIDVLINNAGIFSPNPIDRGDAEWLAGWDETMNINLTASAQLCRLAVRHFSHFDGGRIINIASRAAYRGDSADHWHYAASKGGMVAMTKTIARAYAAKGVYAFAVCPGFTMTGMAEDYLESRGGDKLLHDIPLGRVATPQEIADIVRFCALEAPPSMTGGVIDANGASFVR